jgi:hypothetical protein
MAEGKASSTTSPSQTIRLNQEHEDLFYSLILSEDTPAKILSQLDKCTDASFCEYLTISIDNSNDEEETQGLQELIHLIQEVVNKKAAEQKAQAEIQAEATKAAMDKKEMMETKRKGEGNGPSKIMSNAEVLKQANAIDQAAMTAVMSDDEKPSDFISDCREVVNLSRGFNSNGQMRVGGR